MLSDYALTYLDRPASKTMPPEAYRESIASVRLRRFIRKRLDTELGGKTDLYYTSKGYTGSPR
jgi:hypothetical protein